MEGRLPNQGNVVVTWIAVWSILNRRVISLRQCGCKFVVEKLTWCLAVALHGHAALGTYAWQKMQLRRKKWAWEFRCCFQHTSLNNIIERGVYNVHFPAVFMVNAWGTLNTQPNNDAYLNIKCFWSKYKRCNNGNAILWLRNNGYKEKSRSRVNKVNVERHLLQEEPPLCSALHRANYNISAWRQGPNGSMRPSPINIQLGCMCLLKKILGNPGLSMKWITNKHRQKERR